MALKKSELYSSLWQSCDELRGGMDASQYKDYVLVLLFVKYVSDKYAGQPYAPITIPDGASFADMVALKGKSDIGDQINKKILGPLARENNLLDMPDFNDPQKLGSGKEMVERLTNLISIFENPALDFSKNRADGDDLLGDAYEYLMRHFATESGKSKGQFLTPSEVSLVLALILGVHKKAAQPQLIIEDKGTKSKTKPDFAIGKKKYSAELIPPSLVIARYHAKEQAKIETLEADVAAITQQIEEMAEEHGGDDGLLSEAKNDKDKLTKASAAARLKEITANARTGKAIPGNAKPRLGAKTTQAGLGLGAPGEDAEEIAALQAYLDLSEQESDTGAKLKAAQDALIIKVAAKYGQLTVDEIKTLVVDDKWLQTLAAAVQGELDRVSQTLTGRIRQLAERYASPLPQLIDEVEQLAAKVAGHLKKMGCQP